MKRLVVAISAFISLTAHAQENSLLQQSFWQGKPDVTMIKTEVEKGNNAAQFNSMSFDPVVMAINSDAPAEVIKYLLSQPGNDVNKLTHDGRIYLHWAASRGNVEIMEYLVAKGAKASFIDSHGATPLNFAAGSGQQNTKVYDICLANGADLKKDLNQNGANALLLAIGNDKDLKLTNYFVSKGLDINSKDKEGNNAFSYAVRSGNIEMLKALLTKGIKPTPNAMLMAAQGSRRAATPIAVYEYLESLGLKVTVADQTGNVLHQIVRKPNQTIIIQHFLTQGVDLNQTDEKGNSVLMNAASANRDPEVITLLASKVKDINQVNKEGMTALAMAVQNNSPEVVTLLINKGAKTTILDKSGNNLAFYLLDSYPSSGRQGNRSAAGSRTADFESKLAILKSNGLDVSKPQQNGNTLYHLAIIKNDLALLKRVHEFGIDVNSVNKDGVTVLHRAAMLSKDDETLKYLLGIGAKKDILNNMKESAYDLASENESLAKNNVSVDFLK